MSGSPGYWGWGFQANYQNCPKCGALYPLGSAHHCGSGFTGTIFPPPILPQGWLCPRCRKVNAPTVTACECKPEEETP